MRIFVYSYGIPCSKYPNFGIFAFDHASALADSGHEVIMLILDLRSIRRKRKLFLSNYNKNNLKVIQLSLPIGRMPRVIHDSIDLLLSKFLIRFGMKKFGNPDLIHSHFLRQSYSISVQKKLPIVKLFSTIHDGHLMYNLAYSDIKKLKQIELNTVILTVSPKLQSILTEYSINSIMINNMIDENIFNYNDERQKIQKNIVLSAGALIDGKGMYDLIKACQELSITNYSKLIIMGDGPEREKLVNYVFENNLTENIEFYGLYNRIQFADKLISAKYFILASKTESFGVVYAEALASGIPIIATKCGGPENLVEDSNGLLVELNNQSKLVEAILYMEKNYSSYDSKLISQKTLSEYGTKSVINKLINLYYDNL